MNAPLEAAVDACVFDAYGTLLDVTAAARRCEAALGDKMAPLAELWRTKQLEYTWLRSLMAAPWRDFWGLTGDALDYAMASLEIEDTALRDRLMDLYLTLAPYPEAKGVLEALKEAGLATAILSNGSTGMLSSATTSAGLCRVLDRVLSVDEVEVYKPHPLVYQMAVEHTGVQAERICFLSSNAWDVAGAAHFGFRVVWINRGGAVAERLPGRPVAQVSSLDGLIPLLGL